MVPDVYEVAQFKHRRVRETIEDALVLLRARDTALFEADGLVKVETQFHAASDGARQAILSDPAVGIWSLVDLAPLADGVSSDDATRLAHDLAWQIRYVALGLANHDRTRFETSVRPLPAGAAIPGTRVVLPWLSWKSNFVTISSLPTGQFIVDGTTIRTKTHPAFSGFTLPAGDPLLAPPLLDGYELEPVDTTKLAPWEQLLKNVRAWLNLCPEADSMVSLFGNNLLPLAPSASGAHLSVSFRHRPGVIYATLSSQFVDVMEAIVHEADHQCLYEVTNEHADDALEAFCLNRGQACFRGPLHDVLGRYARCAEAFRADVVMRLTADCPLIDPETSAMVLRRFLESSPAADYASNTLVRSYPRGLDTEVMSVGALLRADQEATDSAEREHVTMHLYRNPSRYRLLSVGGDVDLSAHRWTVDTAEDFELVSRLIEALKDRWPRFGLTEVLSLLRSNPEWKKINAHVEQNKT